MPVHDELGKRMKTYEYVTRTYLTRGTPVIIRVDGKAFHTFTRGFQRPFDLALIAAMQSTMRYMCENIQGCVLGYTQSDEITFVLTDYARLNTAAWFDYNVQKCASVAASMATLVFNRAFRNSVEEIFSSSEEEAVDPAYMSALNRAIHVGAMFDARVFNIPREEVCNCLLWRQLDAVRNSIQMVGQAHFSHSELLGKSCNQIQEMLFQQHHINWNDLPTYLKRGSCCVRTEPDEPGARRHWKIDTEIPNFTGEGRDYVERLVFLTE